MRKRIVIGVLVLITIGVVMGVITFLSEPKRGSVEYHKGEYLKALTDLGNRWIGMAPRLVEDVYWRRRADRIEFHRRALVESGFLTKERFAVSNRPPQEIETALGQHLPYVSVRDKGLLVFVGFASVSNAVIVTAPPGEAMKKLGELIRIADEPESAK
jgi:hypothetical protein